jgi:predicted dithiol-disulfide oxidoreductase (DUF899 family)
MTEHRVEHKKSGRPSAKRCSRRRRRSRGARTNSPAKQRELPSLRVETNYSFETQRLG